MIDTKDLPDDIRHDPRVLSAQLDFQRSHLENHETRITRLEGQQQMIETPVGKMPLHIVLLILLGLIAWRPDIAVKLIGQ